MSRPVLRAALHVLVSWSLVAGPPATATDRSYEGEDESEAAVEASVPEPPEVAAVEASVPEPQVEVEAEVEEAPVIVEPEGPIDDTEEDEVAYDPLIDSPEAQRARSWVRSGAVFVGVGGVLTIGAIAMSQAKVNSQDDQAACTPGSDVAGNGCLAEARNRAVLALALPGALLLAGGMAMLVTGKVQQRRLRTTLRASRREVMFGLRLAF